MRETQPSPLWGRGWTATRALTSGGGQGAPRSACRGGEGVELVKTQYPYRRTRSLARTAGQIDKARELRQTPTETERAAWHLLPGLRSRGSSFAASGNGSHGMTFMPWACDPQVKGPRHITGAVATRFSVIGARCRPHSRRRKALPPAARMRRKRDAIGRKGAAFPHSGGAKPLKRRDVSLIWIALVCDRR